jgi:hypothetical protein
MKSFINFENLNKLHPKFCSRVNDSQTAAVGIRKPVDSGLILPFASSVLVSEHEQLLL